MIFRRRKHGGALDAAFVALAAFVILFGLGVWQLDRRVWKHDLIANINERLAIAPTDLPPREQWPTLNESRYEFRRVAFSAQFLPGEEALIYTAGSPLRPDVSGPGYWVFAPAQLAGGSVVVINRGFVPVTQKDAKRETPPGSVDVTGVLRWPEKRSPFTPDDDLGNNTFFARDLARVAQEKKWGAVAPFYVDQDAPLAGAPADAPRAAPLTVRLPDNHLQYAITWFGLAAALAGVFLFWFAGRRRRR